MKLRITSTALSLLLGTCAYALPQSQDRDKDKPAPQEEPGKQDKPKEKDRQPEKRQPERDHPQDQRQQPRDREREQQDRERHEGERAQQDQQRKARDRAQEQEREGRSARSSGQHQRGRRIPEDRFRASFGREHRFHLQRSHSGGGHAQGSEGQRFQYAGYWFSYAEAWPSDWSYDDDDYYIEYIDDDYYLYDLRHPSVRIVVFVVE